MNISKGIHARVSMNGNMIEGCDVKGHEISIPH